jgi:hypothetical protein
VVGDAFGGHYDGRLISTFALNVAVPALANSSFADHGSNCIPFGCGGHWSFPLFTLGDNWFTDAQTDCFSDAQTNRITIAQTSRITIAQTDCITIAQTDYVADYVADPQAGRYVGVDFHPIPTAVHRTHHTSLRPSMPSTPGNPRPLHYQAPWEQG